MQDSEQQTEIIEKSVWFRHIQPIVDKHNISFRYNFLQKDKPIEKNCIYMMDRYLMDVCAPLPSNDFFLEVLGRLKKGETKLVVKRNNPVTGKIDSYKVDLLHLFEKVLFDLFNPGSGGLVEQRFPNLSLSHFLMWLHNKEKQFGYNDIPEEGLVNIRAENNAGIERDRNTEGFLDHKSHSAEKSKTDITVTDDEALSWSDVAVTLLSEFEIHIQYGDFCATRAYDKAGFLDKRSKLPTNAWKTLIEASLEDGAIRYVLTGDNDPRNRKVVERRVMELRRIFKDLFPGIQEDPIRLDKKKLKYQLIFPLRNNFSIEK